MFTHKIKYQRARNLNSYAATDPNSHSSLNKFSSSPPPLLTPELKSSKDENEATLRLRR